MFYSVHPIGGIIKLYNMNDKEKELNRIIDIVVECCDMAEHGVITKELLLSGSKRENIVMTRCILVYEVVRAGYTITTCAELLGCTTQMARMLMTKDGDFQRSSRAYRLAKEEATKLCDSFTE